MTTKENYTSGGTSEAIDQPNELLVGEHSVKLAQNLSKVEELSKRLTAAMQKKRQVNPSLEGPGQDLMFKTAASLWSEAVSDPTKLFEKQISFWSRSISHFVEAQNALAAGKLEAPSDETPSDGRFSNPLWQSHPYFNFIKQQYLMNAQAMSDAVVALDGLIPEDRKRVLYFTQQIVDMMAPTNFLQTNPDALERAVETDGASLVQGLENLVRDIEANDGDLLVTLADKSAFAVGENLGTSPGKVVFRNRMFELIQYAPTTDEVHETPLIIFPPWINKFYILDLKEQNSLIKWTVDQGFTVFVVSWINPDPSYSDVGMEEYVEEGYLTAIEQVKQICDVTSVNAVGYCIAGTTLSLTLSLLKKRGDTSVSAASFFTTLTDFSDRGEVGVFLNDDFLDGIEYQSRKDGILNSYYMSRTFSYLRSNDLIYRPAIRSYLLGESPPAFDLLYWNGDSTNLPGKMAIQYLRGLCQRDEFASTGFELLGETLHVSDVTVPICAIACETDHIAAWQSSYAGVQKMGSADKTFILSQSGHIAGIINPVCRNKYGHYLNSDMSGTAEAWQKAAEFTPKSSWWPKWGDWLASHAGKVCAARMPGNATHKVICDAPGTYVLPK
jgi:polyhydroxyalkanoate synthase